MMTTAEQHDPAPLNEDGYVIVAAMADGERVDPRLFEAALKDPAVRAYLVDLVALRHAVGTTGLPATAWREARPFRSRLAWLSAAAAILMSVMVGYVAGQRTVQAAPAPSVETVIDLGSPSIAPKPTRIIPLRPGVNWTEKAGER
jgi:hypothetical protein